MLYYLIVSDLKYPTGLGTFLCMKEFKTLDEQIELLTSRGIIIEDEELVKEVLLKENYYKDKSPSLYNKTSGEIYDMNQIVKDSNIKMGTRLVLI